MTRVIKIGDSSIHYLREDGGERGLAVESHAGLVGLAPGRAPTYEEVALAELRFRLPSVGAI